MTPRDRATAFITALPTFPIKSVKEIEKYLRKHEAKHWRHLIDKLEQEFIIAIAEELARREGIQKVFNKSLSDPLKIDDTHRFTHTGVDMAKKFKE